VTIAVTIQEAEAVGHCDGAGALTTAHCPCRLAGHFAHEVPELDGLTARERQVLLLLGDGLPNRPLARRLGIAERTVKAHVANIIDKLGLHTRLEAVVIAVIHHDVLCPAGAR